MKTHELKLDTRFFKEVADHKKTFEVRFDDRGFKVGDYLILKEVVKDREGNVDYTGWEIVAQINYILSAKQFPMGLKEGYVVMSIRVLANGVHMSEDELEIFLGGGGFCHGTQRM